MAAILMSSTEFAQQLEEAGIPRVQVDVIAKGLATMVVHNFDAPVAKDNLDTRFGEFEARMGREMDRNFAEQENRMQLGFAEVNTRVARANVMLAVIMAGVAIPVVQSLVPLLGK